jgi:hypothetical protein
MPLVICEFHENQCRVGNSLLKGTSNDYGCACTMKLYDTLKVKNVLALRVLCQGVLHL